MKLTKYKLGEIAEIQTGPFGSQLHNEDYVHIGTPIVTVEHLGQKEFTTQNLPLVSDADKERLHKYVLRRNDIVFSRVGTVDRCSFVTQKEDGWLFSGRCLRVRPQSNIYAEYLYYLLCTNSIRDYIRSKAVGATMPSLNTELLFNIPITLPSLSDQRRIASVLSNLDRKIALNRQINTNLEALARQLYDYWFVQFDFPDANGNPYKSSGGKMTYNEKLKRHIPDGWRIGNIRIVADILSGGTPSKQETKYWENGTIPFFGPTDYNGNIFQLDTAEKITKEGLKHCASSLFEENTVIITARGSIGKLVVVGVPMAMNQSCYALKSRKGEYEYLYFLTVQLIEHLKAKGSGSVFKSIITSDIENSTLCIGDESIITEFCKKVAPIMKTIKTNIAEISSLTRQRDELLPLLMNGQVSVE